MNYSDPDGPIWQVDYADGKNLHLDKEVTTIRLVSYNIEYAEKIDKAIQEFHDYDELKDADIVILQEMDTTAIDLMAEKLAYNYAYVPAAKNNESAKTFGNAIMSKWPIRHVEKIILPHRQNLNGRQRIAIISVVEIGERSIAIANVHLETFVMNRRHRTEQLREVITHMSQYQSDFPCIIAGDFNTLFQKDRESFTDLLEAYGYQWQSQDMGYTTTALHGLIKPQLDHFYTSGLMKTGMGRIEEATASDHLPVWIHLDFLKNK